jgi:hypothetical protein
MKRQCLFAPSLEIIFASNRKLFKTQNLHVLKNNTFVDKKHPEAHSSCTRFRAQASPQLRIEALKPMSHKFLQDLPQLHVRASAAR